MKTPTSPKIIRAGEGECLALRGETRHQLLDARDTGGAFALARSKFQSGVQTPLHAHTRQDKWFGIESGQFCFQIGEKSHVLGAGDFAFVPRRVPLSYGCDDDGELLIGVVGDSFDAPQLMPKITNVSRSECLEAFGDCARVLISSTDTGNRFCLAEAETPSFSGPPPHLHEREDETFLIRAGRFEFQIGDARVQAAPGDTVFAPRGVAHSFRVVSGEPGRFLLFAAPGGFDSFFRKCAELFQSGAATPQLIGEIGAAHGVQFLVPEA